MPYQTVRRAAGAAALRTLLAAGAASGAALAPRALVAQTAAPDSGRAGVVAALRPSYEGVKGYLLRTAEQASDADYAFRPTPAVRTLGQTLAHVASGNAYYCAAALGERPAQEDVEKTRTTKAAIVEALRASFALCDRAYAMSDAAATTPVRADGNGAARPPLAALVGNVAHESEHYGNLVTYLRLRGEVPPSSQRGG